MSLDPNDSRPPYLQVGHSLRAAILTRRYAPGDKLPSSRDLSEQYGVARMTIQRAIQLLHDEDLVVSRAGSGIYVKERAERPVGLRPHIEAAFQEPNVTIDFAGFSGETLNGAMQEPLDKIRHGQVVPQTVQIRILIPTTETPWALPCRSDDLQDDPAFRNRAHRITSRATSMLSDAVEELQRLGLIKKGSVEIRHHRCAPLFKLYILNGREAFFGFYPITESQIQIDGEEHVIFDLMGKDAILFHHAMAGDESSVESQYVAQARLWFDSVWNTIGQPS
jgi:DNA-binding transcriptional regulator YhcF (GntR family)